MSTFTPAKGRGDKRLYAKLGYQCGDSDALAGGMVEPFGEPDCPMTPSFAGVKQPKVQTGKS